MGWRAWDAYEQDAEDRWRALPWRERYSWRGIAALALIAVLVSLFIWVSVAR